MDREPSKGSKWPAEGPHYTWGSSRGGVDSSGGRLNSNLLRLTWLPGFKSRHQLEIVHYGLNDFDFYQIGS